MGRITKLTKRNILSLFKNGTYIENGFGENFVEYNYIGICDNELNFLERIYNLENLPSYDAKYKNAKEDIYNHAVLRDDYEKCWVFTDDRFNLYGDNDDFYLNFLCEIFNPYVRNEDEPWEDFFDLINELLRKDGWDLYECGRVSGRIEYGYRKYDSNNYKYIPFSIRNEKNLKSKKLHLSIPMNIRDKIYQLLINSNEQLYLVNETGYNYTSYCSVEFFHDVDKFYVPKCFNEKNDYIDTTDIKEFIMKNLPERVFDVIEYFSFYKRSKEFDDAVNYLMKNNNVEFILEEHRIRKSNINSILDTIDKHGIDDLDLRSIIILAEDLFKQDEKSLACEKMWDAFERVKTFYYPEINQKKTSVEKVVDNISTNMSFYELFDSEFRALTEIGNKFRIRHHEKEKININDDYYYEYFYNRCFSLMILILNKLNNSGNNILK